MEAGSSQIHFVRFFAVPDFCRQNGVDVIFHPSADDMYSSGPGVFVAENDLSRRLCGAFRPGHFRGVLT
ncbi:MAG: hypothetical protein EOM73_17475, partial [Bacteroidia bacterium]|nr:hypothetical protein [Bacteroidia bacterium]